MCGQPATQQAAHCIACNEPLLVRAQEFDPAVGLLRPHRGRLVLTLAILSWILCNPVPLLGIAAWIIAFDDLREMKSGRMQAEGESKTQTGLVVAVLHCAFCTGILLLAGGLFAIIVIAAW